MAETNSIAIPPRVKDLTGQRFGRLLVIQYAGLNKHRKAEWLCKCDCGAQKTSLGRELQVGNTRSCGCLRRDGAAARHITHGQTGTPGYISWASMKNRCYNTNTPCYCHYGGRGITVCDEWRNSYETFIKDMGPRPSTKHSIERVDNDGDYEPGNCYWATWAEQARNKRTTRMLTFKGATKPLATWAEQFGIPYTALAERIQKRWTTERALTQPVRGHRILPQGTVSATMDS